MRHRAPILALLLLLLAACGPLPKPFQPAEKRIDALRALDERTRIYVAPLQSPQGPGAPERAAEMLAEALRSYDLPASTSGSPARNRTLVGRPVIQRTDRGDDELLISWELSEPDGSRIGSVAQRRLVSRDLWREGAPEVVEPAMEEAAKAIAALLRPPAIEEARIPGFPGAELVILSMETLPGDGRISLARALEAQLRAADLPVSETIKEQDLLVFGDVILGAPKEGWQSAKVTWYLIRARDGAQLGQISQQNEVPAGSLDRPWGQTATAIARGAVEGILQLLRRAAEA